MSNELDQVELAGWANSSTASESLSGLVLRGVANKSGNGSVVPLASAVLQLPPRESALLTEGLRVLAPRA